MDSPLNVAAERWALVRHKGKGCIVWRGDGGVWICKTGPHTGEPHLEEPDGDWKFMSGGGVAIYFKYSGGMAAYFLGTDGHIKEFEKISDAMEYGMKYQAGEH